MLVCAKYTIRLEMAERQRLRDLVGSSRSLWVCERQKVIYEAPFENNNGGRDAGREERSTMYLARLRGFNCEEVLIVNPVNAVKIVTRSHSIMSQCLKQLFSSACEIRG